MKVDEYIRLDGLALAELVRLGHATPAELVDACIARIEMMDGMLNAVVFRQFDEARQAARNQGFARGAAYAGVPFLLKDNLDVEGVPNSYGSRLRQDYRPSVSSPLAEAYSRAGFIVCGRTNQPEFAMEATTEPLLFGPTPNPWDLSRTSGGSSGGAAAAVAAGYVPVAHGSDVGGSIRNPASVTGTFGLRPTSERVPYLQPGQPANPWLSHHVISRSVRDSAALLDLTQAPDAPKAGCGSYLAALSDPPRGLRIALYRSTLEGAPIDAECEIALDGAERLLVDLGHDVRRTDSSPFFAFDHDPEAWADMISLMYAERIASAEALTGQAATPELVEPRSWTMLQRSKRADIARVEALRHYLDFSLVELQALLEEYDAVMSPTIPTLPLPLDGNRTKAGEAADDAVAVARDLVARGASTVVYNVLNVPAMSVPLHWSAGGLPVGVQFAARRWREDILLRLAAQLESAQPWFGRYADVPARRQAA